MHEHALQRDLTVRNLVRIILPVVLQFNLLSKTKTVFKRKTLAFIMVEHLKKKIIPLSTVSLNTNFSQVKRGLLLECQLTCASDKFWFYDASSLLQNDYGLQLLF